MTDPQAARITEINEQIRRARGCLVDYEVAVAVAITHLRANGDDIEGWDDFRDALRSIAEYHGER